MDRGHHTEFKTFINSIIDGQNHVDRFNSYYHTTLTTFAVLESLKRNKKIKIKDLKSWSVLDVFIGSNIDDIIAQIPDHFKNQKTVIKPNFVLHGRNVEAKCTSNYLLEKILNKTGLFNSIIVSGGVTMCIGDVLHNRCWYMIHFWQA